MTVHDPVNNKTSPSNLFEGKLVSMTGNHVVVTNIEGIKSFHTLAKDATLTCDGTACQAGDLKVGHRIRMTTRRDAQNVATGIESLNQHDKFTQCR